MLYILFPKVGMGIAYIYPDTQNALLDTRFSDKGKPVVRRGHKVYGPETAIADRGRPNCRKNDFLAVRLFYNKRREEI